MSGDGGEGARPFSLRQVALTAYGPTVVNALGHGAVLPVLALRARELGADLGTAALVVAVRAGGIAGAGAAQAAVTVALMLPLHAYVLRRSGAEPEVLLRSLVPPLVHAALVVVAVRLVLRVLESWATAPIVMCIVGGAVGSAVAVAPHVGRIRVELEQRRTRERPVPMAVGETR